MNEQLKRWADRIDHVVITTDAVAGVMGWFEDVFGLPLAWPLTRWLEVPEGGVAGGDCNIGVCVAPPGSPTSLDAVAFDPISTAAAARDELLRRGVAVSDTMASGTPSVPDDSRHRPWSNGWIDVVLTDWPTRPAPFVCEYLHDRTARRSDEAERFDARTTDGPSVLGVARVVVHSAEPSIAIDRWARAVGPVDIDGRGRFTFGHGPGLEVREGPDSGALVFQVRDVGDSARQLSNRGVGVEAVQETSEHRLVDERLGGLDVRITAEPG